MEDTWTFDLSRRVADVEAFALQVGFSLTHSQPLLFALFFSVPLSIFLALVLQREDSHGILGRGGDPSLLELDSAP